MTPEQKQKIIEYEEDITDAERSVESAKKEVKEAEKWLLKIKLNHAEAVIRLHNYLKEIGEIS